MGYADLCLCHSQSCTTSSSTVGLTCCSTSVVIRFVYAHRAGGDAPDLRAVSVLFRDLHSVLFAEEAPRLQLVHQQKIVEAAQFPRLVRQGS